MILVFLITLDVIEALSYSCYNAPIGDNKACFMKNTEEGKYSPIDKKINSDVCGDKPSETEIKYIVIRDGEVEDYARKDTRSYGMEEQREEMGVRKRN